MKPGHNYCTCLCKIEGSEKMSLLVIGRAEKPRCLLNVQSLNVQVQQYCMDDLCCV
jgi:hypothetical protein